MVLQLIRDELGNYVYKDPRETSKIPLRYFAYGFGAIKPMEFSSQSNFLKHIKFDKKIKNNKMKFILLQDFAKPVAYVVKDENILNNFLEKNLF